MNADKPVLVKKAEWISPSNIALIKYWGKKGKQLPANASLSMSLKNSITRTIVTSVQSKNPAKTQFFFGGVHVPEFETGIVRFLKNISGYFPFLKECSLKIESWNTFPHSAGIASSASSMSALALCLCDISRQVENAITEGLFYRKASEIARIGSGSASRSVYGGFNVWGKNIYVKDSSDEFAVPLDFSVHPVFSKLQDTILIVNSAEKKISSTLGHEMMNQHPYSKQRYNLAEKNLEIMLKALKSGNTNDFVDITEKEALGLHSLMLSSDPAFILIEPGTLQIIEKILDFRKKTGRFICFTLDAGPNVHLLYPESEKTEIIEFINTELIIHCEKGKVLWDECGDGPKKIEPIYGPVGGG